METITREGLRLSVARVAGPDCTNGGVTATCDKLTLVGTVDDSRIPMPRWPRVIPLPNMSRVVAVTPDAPAVAIRVKNAGWSRGEVQRVAHLVPVESDGEGGYRCSDAWWMAGGNYASALDSRVSDALALALGHRFYGALSVHDRREF